MERREAVFWTGAALALGYIGYSVTQDRTVDPASFAKDYYPEIAGRFLRQTLEIQRSAKLWVLNYTQTPVRKEVVEAACDYLEEVILPKKEVGSPTQPDLRFGIFPRQTTARYLFLVDEAAPAPFWGRADSLGQTSRFSDNSYAFYIRLFRALPAGYEHLKKAEVYNTMALAIEVCHSYLSPAISPEDVDNSPPLVAIQESICNSTGLTFASRQADKSYPEYKNFASGITLGGHKDRFVSPVILSDEPDYNQIKEVGSLTK